MELQGQKFKFKFLLLLILYHWILPILMLELIILRTLQTIVHCELTQIVNLKVYNTLSIVHKLVSRVRSQVRMDGWCVHI